MSNDSEPLEGEGHLYLLICGLCVRWCLGHRNNQRTAGRWMSERETGSKFECSSPHPKELIPRLGGREPRWEFHII